MCLSSPQTPDRLWGPPSLLYNHYRRLFLRVKRSRRQADHSSIFSTDVKRDWSYTSTPPYVFMKWSLIKHRGVFAFLVLVCMSRSSSIFLHDMNMSGVKPGLLGWKSEPTSRWNTLAFGSRWHYTRWQGRGSHSVVSTRASVGGEFCFPALPNPTSALG
jgi:hypothetical protein